MATAEFVIHTRNDAGSIETREMPLGSKEIFYATIARGTENPLLSTDLVDEWLDWYRDEGFKFNRDRQK
jgi:hypothetical protein